MAHSAVFVERDGRPQDRRPCPTLACSDRGPARHGWLSPRYPGRPTGPLQAPSSGLSRLASVRRYPAWCMETYTCENTWFHRTYGLLGGVRPRRRRTLTSGRLHPAAPSASPRRRVWRRPIRPFGRRLLRSVGARRASTCVLASTRTPARGGRGAVRARSGHEGSPVRPDPSQGPGTDPLRRPSCREPPSRDARAGQGARRQPNDRGQRRPWAVERRAGAGEGGRRDRGRPSRPEARSTPSDRPTSSLG